MTNTKEKLIRDNLERIYSRFPQIKENNTFDPIFCYLDQMYYEIVLDIDYDIPYDTFSSLLKETLSLLLRNKVKSIRNHTKAKKFLGDFHYNQLLKELNNV